MDIRKQIGLKLPKEMIAEVDKARGMVSRTSWIEQAIQEKLGKSIEVWVALPKPSVTPPLKPPLPVAEVQPSFKQEKRRRPVYNAPSCDPDMREEEPALD